MSHLLKHAASVVVAASHSQMARSTGYSLGLGTVLGTGGQPCDGASAVCTVSGLCPNETASADPQPVTIYSESLHGAEDSSQLDHDGRRLLPCHLVLSSVNSQPRQILYCVSSELTG